MRANVSLATPMSHSEGFHSGLIKTKSERTNLENAKAQNPRKTPFYKVLLNLTQSENMSLSQSKHQRVKIPTPPKRIIGLI